MDNAAFPNFFLGAVTSGCLCKRHCPTLQNWVSELILDNAALLQQYSQKRHCSKWHQQIHFANWQKWHH